MNLCVRVRVCVCEEDVHKKREWRKSKKKKEKNGKTINSFIQINKQTGRQTDKQTDTQTDGRTDRQKSFIDMRYYTEQYSKSNSIE